MKASIRLSFYATPPAFTRIKLTTRESYWMLHAFIINLRKATCNCLFRRITRDNKLP